jgi:type III pantothenate kinase
MNQWLFDLGNTRLKCMQLGDDGALGPVIAFGHDQARFATALREHLHGGAATGAACLASVASPVLTAAVLEVLSGHFQRISIARTQARFGGVEIAYAQPARLGVDRFLALVAAHARAPGPQLIVGVGTALTVDLLDAQGRHQGGRIAPSPQLMRQALHRAAAQLPATGGDYREFAVDTGDALASGCDGAAIGLIQRSLQQATAPLGQAPHLLLHGGGAESLLPQLPEGAYVPTLVLEGLAQWACAGIRR